MHIRSFAKRFILLIQLLTLTIAFVQLFVQEPPCSPLPWMALLVLFLFLFFLLHFLYGILLNNNCDHRISFACCRLLSPVIQILPFSRWIAMFEATTITMQTGIVLKLLLSYCFGFLLYAVRTNTFLIYIERARPRVPHLFVNILFLCLKHKSDPNNTKYSSFPIKFFFVCMSQKPFLLSNFYIMQQKIMRKKIVLKQLSVAV